MAASKINIKVPGSILPLLINRLFRFSLSFCCLAGGVIDHRSTLQVNPKAFSIGTSTSVVREYHRLAFVLDGLAVGQLNNDAAFYVVGMWTLIAYVRINLDAYQLRGVGKRSWNDLGLIINRNGSTDPRHKVNQFFVDHVGLLSTISQLGGWDL